ncbi:MAG TPA: helix-turn-helix transcriptional regulator [Ktedonobacteraceae bacterium]|jgi:transcriptional regulator with XRE-family HTH domain
MNPFLLKAARKQQGWSQAQVAEALGITERTVRRWERGLVIPYPYYRQQLCALFSKTAQDLGLPPEMDEDEDVEKAPIPMTQLPKQDVLVEEKVKESPTLELEDSISRRNAYFGKTAQDLGLPPEMDEDEDEDMEKAPIPMTQPLKQDVLVEEKVKKSLTLEQEGSISRRNAYKIPSLMNIIDTTYSLPILKRRHGKRRSLRMMYFLLVIMVMASLAFLPSELSIFTVRKTPEVRKTPTSQAEKESAGVEVEPQVQNRCNGPDWQSHTGIFGQYYTVKTNGSPFCYYASWTVPSDVTAAKSCDLRVFSYPGSTATIRYFFSTYHRNSVYTDINQTTSDWSYFPRYMDISLVELYVNDNQSGTTISVGPFFISNCQTY